jgi:transcriptional antiterminator Rof (Rho-off)
MFWSGKITSKKRHSLAKLMELFEKKSQLSPNVLKDMLPYRPIDCALYDHLEWLIGQVHAPCEIVFTDEQGQVQSLTALPNDLQTVGGEEFLCLNNGQRIRLDRLKRIGDRQF